MHGAFLVVELRVGLDLNRHVAAAAVKLAYVFDVAEKAHGVGGLAGRQVDEGRDFAGGDGGGALPVDAGS